MASSNRHWPSMFKSKSTTHQDHQWHNHLPTQRSSSYTSGCDERTPEPKPRWNPKPEQIRILESIFNSGLVNPPRDEIRRIRARLQEYGQVGDANVFYWFQNRKSRTKHKNRHLQKSQNHQPQSLYGAGVGVMKVATASPTSSSEKSSKSIEFFFNSPTGSVNKQSQACLGEGGGISSLHQHHGEFFQESFFLPVVQQKPRAPTTTRFTQGFCFPEVGAMIDQENHHVNADQTIVSSCGMQPTNLMMMNQYGNQSKIPGDNEVEEDHENIINMLNHNTQPPALSPLAASTTTVVPSSLGVEEVGRRKSIVFINDEPYEVDVGRFNVKEAFGGDVVLIDSSGQTVVTDEWGVTLQPLEHGAFYQLVRSFPDDHGGTEDMV
ncbi:hypothetical protein QVD17_33431 [Tagetes erecta]|uniref:Protein WUSCHEL n=1 Tax=Tagetes erecta TaxID=13708 RepID=A0AAD8JYT3_TARER|nr:hypothetical protein QVD17_33431 [Tagetes erecta]